MVFGTPTTGIAVFEQPLCDGQRTVAADADERAQTERFEVPFGLVEDLRRDLVLLAMTGLGGEPAAIGRAEHGAARGEQRAHLAMVELLVRDRVEQALHSRRENRSFPSRRESPI